jgi:hypothetical protein
MLRSNHTKKNDASENIFRQSENSGKPNGKKRMGVLENKMPTPISLSFFHMKYYPKQVWLPPTFEVKSQEKKKKSTKNIFIYFYNL